MAPRPLEVYQVDARFPNSTDARPCVVLEPRKGGSPAVRAISAPQIKGDRWSSKRLLGKDDVRKKGFWTGSELLESGELKL